ncbi:MAG: hypothetical protein JWR37_361, partial [Mycobacterium sp.]|nr:hypothetical protein [Mycobacterium sp.]
MRLAPIRRPVQRVHGLHAEPAQRLRLPGAYTATHPGQANEIGVSMENEIG